MSQISQNVVEQALWSRGVSLRCPHCQGEQWTVAGLCMLFNQRHPPVSIICAHCGFVSMHAIEELGLIHELPSSKRQSLWERWCAFWFGNKIDIPHRSDHVEL